MNECWSCHVLRNLPPLNAVRITGKDGREKLAIVISENQDGTITVIESNDEYSIEDNRK